MWNGFQVDPENVPLSRPGAYLFTCLINGKCYVGVSVNVAKRCCGRDKDRAHLPLSLSMRKYGKANFLIQPLYYSLDPESKGEELTEVETDLIISWDSLLPMGYNIIASSQSGGKRGEEYVRRQVVGIVRAWADEEKKAVRLAKFIWPEYSAKLSEVWKQFHADPEKGPAYIAKRNSGAWTENLGRALKKVWKDPIKYQQLVKERNNPVSNAKRAAGHRAAWKKRPRIWITNGIEETNHFISQVVPDGWRRGRLPKTDEVRQKIAAGVTASWKDPEISERVAAGRRAAWQRSPLVWITDGKINKRVVKGAVLPDGFRLGRKFLYKGQARGGRM